MRHNRKGVIGVCISLLLKNRFAKACFVQKVISLILYSGHASKQVISATDHNILPVYIIFKQIYMRACTHIYLFTDIIII